MKAIITGATGYIGSNLLKELISQCWEVAIIAQPEFGYEKIIDQKNKIKILDYYGDSQKLIEFFLEIKPDVVFHLAAAIILDHKPNQIATLIQSNIQFGTEVLEAMRYSSTPFLINTGTYWQNFNSDDYNPVDLYAATKESFETILKYYSDAFGIRAVTLRLYDVYGENDTRPKLLNRLKEIAGTDKQIDVSPGEQLLDMIYISDVCNAFIKAYEYINFASDITNGIFGVYSGNRIKLFDLIRLFEEVIGQKINVNFGAKPYKAREIMIPTTSYMKLPNWNCKVSLPDGLSRFKK